MISRCYQLAGGDEWRFGHRDDRGGCEVSNERILNLTLFEYRFVGTMRRISPNDATWAGLFLGRFREECLYRSISFHSFVVVLG